MPEVILSITKKDVKAAEDQLRLLLEAQQKNADAELYKVYQQMIQECLKTLDFKSLLEGER